jgi:hypothetical protein
VWHPAAGRLALSAEVRDPVVELGEELGPSSAGHSGHAEVADDPIAVRHFPQGYARTVEGAALRWAAGSWTAW